MKTSMRIKLFLYRIFTTRVGKTILNLMLFGIKAEGLNENKPKNHEFIVAITIDTESGYVENNERRVWQMESPNAFMGYYNGIGNLLKLFGKYNVKSTFFLSTQCFSSKGKEREEVQKQLKKLLKYGHELGLHMHPDSDFALQKKLSRKFRSTSAFFYDYETKLGFIRASKELIKENLGNEAHNNLTSFRWGNWALDSAGAKALAESGFKIDSSATPGIKGHAKDGMKYDWSMSKIHYPWNLNFENYQNAGKTSSGIVEIPIATFSFFGFTMRADPANSSLLLRAFDYYYSNADRSKNPFIFVVITHSSEATYKNGMPTRAVKSLEELIIHAKKFRDVKFSTLKESKNLAKV